MKSITWDSPKITQSCNGSIFDSPAPPDSLDWASKSKVSEVGAQGLCEKDWAMVAVSAVESLYAIKYNLTEFSVQQVVDCSGDYGS